MNGRRVVVTGAFGYSGKAIARKLLDCGDAVATLTNSPLRPNPFQGAVTVFPLNFADEDQLARSMDGADCLVNTYWVRFNHRNFTYAQAVRNSIRLFSAARKAGVGRIVHVSITNPSEDSPYEYFQGKGVLERALAETGVPHSILRPAVLFGGADILLNNIAWSLRRFPVFGVFGDGRYRLVPIHVEDFADLALREAGESGNRLIQAVGPEVFSFREMVETVGAAIGKPRPILEMPPMLAHAVAWVVGKAVGDVMLTRDEVRGLMDDLLFVDAPSAGTTRLTEWTRKHANSLGVCYASELSRRLDRTRAYEHPRAA